MEADLSHLNLLGLL